MLIAIIAIVKKFYSCAVSINCFYGKLGGNTSPSVTEAPKHGFPTVCSFHRKNRFPKSSSETVQDTRKRVEDPVALVHGCIFEEKEQKHYRESFRGGGDVKRVVARCGALPQGGVPVFRR